MQDPLGQAQVELAAVDGLAPVGVTVGVAAVQEHQVEIRAVAELDAAELAVGHHGEAALAAQRHLGGHPVALAHLGPGLIDHLFGDGLRQPGEVVAHLHQRQGAGNVGSDYAQQLYLLELAQRLHLLLHVLFGDAQQELAQLGLVLVQRGGVVEVLGIQQLVQQYGVAGELLAHQVALVAQAHQLAQGGGVLRQQLQVGAAGEDAGQQGADPLEQAGGLTARHHQSQQLGHQPVQGDAPLGPDLAALVLLLEAQQGGAKRSRIANSLGGEQFLQLGGIELGAPEIEPELLQVSGGLFLFPHHGDELLMDYGHLLVEVRHEALPVGEAGGGDQSLTIPLLGGQGLGLLIADLLQYVLDPAQEAISLEQARAALVIEGATLGYGRQGLGQVAHPQGGLATATDELQRLGDELHLADAAGPQLDVALQPLAAHLGGDHRLHLAQAVDDAEVDVAAKHEGAQQLGEGLGVLALGPQHPRLDHGVALPVAAMVLVVVLHGGKGDGERPRLAEGAQPHVDSEHLTILGGLVQGVDQALAQLDEELLVGEFAPPADRVAVVGEGEDEVDVRGEVQLAAPQLAHAEDEQGLRVAVAVHGGAELGALFGVEPVPGAADQRVRELGEMDETLFDLGLTQQLAPGDHQHAAASELAQHALERLLVMDFGEQGRQIALVGGPALGQRQIPGGQGLRQQLGLLDEGVGDEIREAKQGQQGLLLHRGQIAIVGGLHQQPLPLAPGLILQQG
ncbi:hypothetical protein D3C80_536180 [compost metagenome]